MNTPGNLPLQVPINKYSTSCIYNGSEFTASIDKKKEYKVCRIFLKILKDGEQFQYFVIGGNPIYKWECGTKMHLTFTENNLFVLIPCKPSPGVPSYKNMYVFPKQDILVNRDLFADMDYFDIGDTWGKENKCSRYEDVDYLGWGGGESVLIANFTHMVGREFYMIKNITKIEDSSWLGRLKSEGDKNTIKYGVDSDQMNEDKSISEFKVDDNNNLTVTYYDGTETFFSQPKSKQGGGKKTRRSRYRKSSKTSRVRR